ncbi:MAG: sugar transferase [Candidatus Marinimicrobia bacterium]|nr:sugar transferase [Candidatus Neomarinimicrobiota bacterium]
MYTLFTMSEMKNNKLKAIGIHTIIVIISFLMVSFYKYKGFSSYRYTWEILGIIILSNLFIKLNLKDLHNIHVRFYHGLMTIAKSGIYLLFMVSFFIVILKLYTFSRLLVFGTVGIVTLIESLTYLFEYFLNKEKLVQESAKNRKISLMFGVFLLDFSLWYVSFLVLNKADVLDFANNVDMQKAFLVLTALWIGNAIITGKYAADLSQNFWHLISPIWKSTVLIGAGSAFLRFFMRGFYLSNFEVFYFLLLFMFLEIFLVFLYYLLFRISGKVDDYEGNINVSEVLNEYDVVLEDKEFAIDTLTRLVESKKVNNTIKNLQDLIDFIASIPKLQELRHEQTLTYDTEHLFNIEELKKHSLHLLINLHIVNDFPALNTYFLTVYKKLVPGGYFVSKVRTIDLHREKFYRTYPKFLAQFFYTFHYLFNRIFPYVPVFDKIHYLLTGGRRSVIAKAEVLGRLTYCGYKVVSTHVIGDYLYFVSQKSKFPALRETPSTNLIIKLKRVGLNGKVFNLYKFRTMYPYSEFLQEYIYELNSLNETGKILDDFRITGWGRIMRKFWLDELPQLYNYLKGDIGIFGARALSQHYFSLYPPRVRELRIKFKNGLVPPYYADMPKTFDEIVRSEEVYFEKKMKKPFSTDVVYFTRAIKNILFKKARSM